jgi:hypothetical protein
MTKELEITPLSVQRVLDVRIQCEWCQKCASPKDAIYEYTLASRQKRYFHSGCFKLAGGSDRIGCMKVATRLSSESQHHARLCYLHNR